MSVEVWHAGLEVRARTQAAGESELVRLVELSREKYLKPVGRLDYAPGTEAEEWGEAGRGDYSVALREGGVSSEGWAPGRWQELGVRLGLRTLAGRYTQLEISGTGRVKVCGVDPNAAAGPRRAGVIV